MARLFVGGNFTTVAGKMGKRRNDLRSQARGKNLEAAKVLEKMIRGAFSSDGASIGEKWAPLKASTAKRKRGMGRGFFLPLKLIRSGKMVKSIKSTATNQWGRVAFGRNTPAIFHERGTKRMVSRELLPSESVALRAVFPIYKKWVRIVINR